MSEFEATSAVAVPAEAVAGGLPEKLQEIEDRLISATWLSEILKMEVIAAQLEDMSTAGLTEPQHILPSSP
jgi:acyl carrier protein phosphodiesterase